MYKNINYYDSLTYQNLTDKAYDILEEMIVTCELKLGQTYSEADFSAFTNIGRTPVREAIKRLELTHTISIIPRSGIYINTLKIEECFLQMEVRNMLEKLVAVRAAKFSLPQERESFKILSEKYEIATKNKDNLSSTRIDNEFNHLMGDCARNIFAKGALMPLHTMARRLYYTNYLKDEKLTNSINNAHIEVMNAISLGDEKNALYHTEKIIEYVKKQAMLSLEDLITNNDILNMNLRL